ncbi:MAG: hypothetical protein ACE149_01530 [Armatimonadota bacterium]
METLFLIYDEAFEAEITGIIERGMIVSRYTRVDNVVGARMVEREAIGYLADRRNRLIIIVAEPATMAKLVDGLRELRTRRGHGLRAFVVKAETVI